MFSPHNESMARYEIAVAEAKASDRKSVWQGIEDRLVEGGIVAIEEYEQQLDDRWKAARCLAQFDGVGIGRDIAKRARERLTKQG